MSAQGSMCVYSGRVLLYSGLELCLREKGRLWGTGVPISMAVLVRNAELESSYRGREVFIDDTSSPLGTLPGGRQSRQTHVHGWELGTCSRRGGDSFLSSRSPNPWEVCPGHRPTSRL